MYETGTVLTMELHILPSCYRLLLEDSDEEDGDLCRICQMGEESASNPLIQPCRCTGSLQYVHQECIKRWLRSKIGSGKYEPLTWLQLPPKSHLVKQMTVSLFSLSFRHKPWGHHNMWTLQGETAFEHRQLWHPGVIQDTRASESPFNFLLWENLKFTAPNTWLITWSK